MARYKKIDFEAKKFFHTFAIVVISVISSLVLYDMYIKIETTSDVSSNITTDRTYYMNENIQTEKGKIGLPASIYTKKPTQKLDFAYSRELNALKEPENLLEELNNIWNKMTRLFVVAEQIILEK